MSRKLAGLISPFLIIVFVLFWEAGGIVAPNPVHGKEGGEVKHYQTFRSDGNNSIAIDHFEVHGQALSLELSPDWELTEGTGDILAQAFYRFDPTIFIKILVFPMDKTPDDLKAADQFYRAEIQKRDTLNVNKGGDDADLNDPSLFAKIYSLADSNGNFPRGMATFLIKPPFFYRMTIEFPEKFIGKPRVDYEKMVHSIILEETSPSPGGVPPTPPIQGTNAPPSVTPTNAISVAIPPPAQTNQTDNATQGN